LPRGNGAWRSQRHACEKKKGLRVQAFYRWRDEDRDRDIGVNV